MTLDIAWTSKFKKDYKQAMRQHKDISLLDDVIRALSRGETLPQEYQDHALKGKWAGQRECHILPDWLLIYKVENNLLILTLSRTGSHSDIFG